LPRDVPQGTERVGPGNESDDRDAPPQAARLAEVLARCEHLEASREAAEDRAATAIGLVRILQSEIRQPLDDVSRLMHALSTASLDAERRRLVTTADCSLTTMLSLLNAIGEEPLAGPRGAAGPAEPFDLRITVGHAVALLDPLATAGGLQLQCEVDPRVPNQVRGDQTAVHQLLVFAVNQAIRHSARGAVVVRVAPAPELGQGMLRFSAHNDGDGLPCEVLDRILRRTALVDGIDQGLAAAFGIYERLATRQRGALRVDTVGVRGFCIWFSAHLEDASTSGDERREGHRRRQDMLTCSLGDVIDLSIGGMRVTATRRARGRVPVKVFDWQTAVEFEAEVVWSRRLAFRRHELGLRFIHLSPEQSRHLNRIWLHHSLRRIRADDAAAAA
jgi:hypothetical protein